MKKYLQNNWKFPIKNLESIWPAQFVIFCLYWGFILRYVATGCFVLCCVALSPHSVTVLLFANFDHQHRLLVAVAVTVAVVGAVAVEGHGAEQDVKLFWAAAGDVVALGHAAGAALAPPPVSALGRAGGGATLWVALVLPAVGRALAPTGLLAALDRALIGRRGAYARTDRDFLTKICFWRGWHSIGIDRTFGIYFQLSFGTFGSVICIGNQAF